MRFTFKIVGLRWPLTKYLIFIILLQANTPGSSMRLPQNSFGHHKPEIILTRFTKGDSFERIFPEEEFQSRNKYQNDFVSKSGSDYVIAAETKSVDFTCAAKYPITWTFPFPKQLGAMDTSIDFKDYRISKFEAEKSDPISVSYKVVLRITFTLVDFLSVNVTCISVENKPQVQSSIHIFLEGKAGLENEGKTLMITAEPAPKFLSPTPTSSSPVILPCRPSSPNGKLFLEKESNSNPFKFGYKTSGNKTWIPVNLSRATGFLTALSFQPKVGFVVHRGHLGDNDIFGVYRCSVLYSGDDGTDDVDTDQFVIVNVTAPSNSSDKIATENISFEPKLSLRGSASVQVQMSRDYVVIPRPEIQCCSGVEDKPPKLYVQYCLNPLSCEITKNTLYERMANWHSLSKHLFRHDEDSDKDCSRSVIVGPFNIAICKGENVDYGQEFVHIFRPEMSGSVENRSDRIQKADLKNNHPGKWLHRLLPRSTSLTEYVTEIVSENINTGQKMAVTTGKISATSEGDDDLASFPIEFTQIYDQIMEAAIGQDTLSLLEAMDVEEEKHSSVSLMEYNRDYYYEGERLTFMCFGVKYFYSFGPHLRLNWKNGTKTILKDMRALSPRESDIVLLYMSGNAIIFEAFGDDIIAVFGMNMTASEDMSSVDCWMPVRNSSKWDKLSKSVKVLPTVAPKFAEETEEIVYFYLGEVGKVATCTVVAGVPLPSFTLTKDGKVRSLEYDEITNVTSSSSKWDNGYSLTKGETKSEKSEDGNYFIKLKINFQTVNITYRHHNVWKCIAENVNGTVTRTIKVIVIDKPGIALPVSLAMVGVLCLVLLGLGIKHCYDKRTVTSLRANPIL